MTKEVPQSSSTMAAFRAKALERGKGKGNLETVVADNPFTIEQLPCHLLPM